MTPIRIGPRVSVMNSGNRGRPVGTSITLAADTLNWTQVNAESSVPSPKSKSWFPGTTTS